MQIFQPMMLRLLLFVGFCLLSLSNSWAVDRALLVGVGKYKNDIANLPGVQVDIENMKEAAQLMGYAGEQIKVMMNEQVTLNNLKAAIKDWLIDGTGIDDRVLLYFTGHGSRIADISGDEKDGADEVLVMYDSQVVLKNNKKTIKNAFLDDDLNTYLKQIKSQDMMLLVDACNSGTVYRGFVGDKNSAKAFSKFLSYSGIPNKDKRTAIDLRALSSSSPSSSNLINSHSTLLDKELRRGKAYRFVAITAAGDDELALATKNGSLFTSGIRFHLQQAALNNQPITPKQLSDRVAIYIQEKIQQQKLGAVYRPQLAGNQLLVNKAISINRIEAKPNWKQLEKLAQGKNKIAMYSESDLMRIGDKLIMHLKLPQQGYLNVINIDPSDQAFIVYPASQASNNFVKRGNISLPTPDMGFDLQLTEPRGQNLFLALLSQQPINVNQGLGGSGILQAEQLKDFAQALKAKSGNQYWAGKLIIDVIEP